MIRFGKYIHVLVLICLLIGCGSREPLYQGLPLSVWVVRLNSPDEEVRADALTVIAEIGKPAESAENYVREIAEGDPSTNIRMKAIEALEAMDASTARYQDFIDKYYAPLIPEEDDLPVNELVDSEDDEDIFEGISGEDDLEFLEALERGILDTAPESRFNLEPTDSVAKAEKLINMQREEVAKLFERLRNPQMLSQILAYGNAIEREFAGQILAELTEDDPQVLKAIENVLSDSSDQVRKALELALKQWAGEE